MALTGLAIAAGLALAKDQLVDQPAAKRKRQLAANTQRLSPWTGLRADPVEDPNTIGTMMGWGATGAQIGAGLKKSGQDAAIKDVAVKNAQRGLTTPRINVGVDAGGGMSNPWSYSTPWDWNRNPYAP